MILKSIFVYCLLTALTHFFWMISLMSKNESQSFTTETYVALCKIVYRKIFRQMEKPCLSQPLDLLKDTTNVYKKREIKKTKMISKVHLFVVYKIKKSIKNQKNQKIKIILLFPKNWDKIELSFAHLISSVLNEYLVKWGGKIFYFTGRYVFIAAGSL